MIAVATTCRLHCANSIQFNSKFKNSNLASEQIAVYELIDVPFDFNLMLQLSDKRLIMFHNVQFIRG